MTGVQTCALPISKLDLYFQLLRKYLTLVKQKSLEKNELTLSLPPPKEEEEDIEMSESDSQLQVTSLEEEKASPLQEHRREAALMRRPTPLSFSSRASRPPLSDVSSQRIEDIYTQLKALLDDEGVPLFKDVITNASKDRKSTRLNSSHIPLSRMPSSA